MQTLRLLLTGSAVVATPGTISAVEQLASDPPLLLFYLDADTQRREGPDA